MNTNKKNKILAVILCLLLGQFGVHRFYMGYWKSALIMILVTFVFSPITSIWMIIDVLLILTNKLNSKIESKEKTENSL